jgi:hypothetical protein
LVGKRALIHNSVREAAGREGTILTDQNRYYDCFGSKTESPKGFCGSFPAFRHMDGKRALIHNSVREAAGREGTILTAQNRDYDCFGSKTASLKGFCGALPAFRQMDGKRAVVHFSVRKAAKRTELILTDQNRDYERFEGKMTAQTGLCSGLTAYSGLGVITYMIEKSRPGIRTANGKWLHGQITAPWILIAQC